MNNTFLNFGGSTLESFVELLGLVAIFIIILVLAYFTSKWIGRQGGIMPSRNPNMQIIETLKISQTKYIQIIKVTDRYIVIGISKDKLDFITELSEDKIVKSDMQKETFSIKDILTKVKPHSATADKSEDTFAEVLKKKQDKDE